MDCMCAGLKKNGGSRGCAAPPRGGGVGGGGPPPFAYVLAFSLRKSLEKEVVEY